jgi:non-heme chloroperoxidase
MAYMRTRDGVDLFYKDWGPRDGRPIVFHHGWPLSADEWDAQMMFFGEAGYRTVAFDRRGHGRSAQTDQGNDMDTYAADVGALVEALDLWYAIHVGHSTGGGEVTRYVARAGPGRVAAAVLIDAVTPLLLQRPDNPQGAPKSAFDDYRRATAQRRADFYLEIASGPFYGFNRPNTERREGLVRNWWRQGMEGGVKAQYDCVAAFSETDFRADLAAIDVPVLVLHGEDDQIVPLPAAQATASLLKRATLKTYPGLPHGMPTSHPDIVNADILEFIRGDGGETGTKPAACRAGAWTERSVGETAPVGEG